MSRREKPGVGFWIVATLATLLIIYPLSIGPYLWLSDRALWAVRIFDPVYDPLRWIMHSTAVTDKVINTYCSFWRTTGIPGPKDPP
jgi:hypothetical protein